jgi:hypothetical protein
MNYGGEFPKNIYEWFDLLRVRPLNFLGTMDSPLVKLESMLIGYYMCLDSHRQYENVPPLDIHFIQWLSTQRKWGFAGGFAKPFAENTPSEMSQLELFFQFVDEYRKLKPTELLTVNLSSSHKATGRRVKIGGEKIINRPDRISIVQYKPKRLHLLRFYYGTRIQDDSFLCKTDKGISYSTSIADAKKWVHDEFNVLDEEWRRSVDMD